MRVDGSLDDFAAVQFQAWPSTLGSYLLRLDREGLPFTPQIDLYRVAAYGMLYGNSGRESLS